MTALLVIYGASFVGCALCCAYQGLQRARAERNALERLLRSTVGASQDTEKVG